MATDTPVRDPQTIRDWMCGPIVATATPFKEDYELDLDALQGHIRFMIEGGVQTGDGVLLVAAAAGEHPTLNVEERKTIMDLAVEAARGQVPIAASIQHTDWRVIEDLAKHAEKVGVSVVQLAPPYYYRATESDVLRLFEMVASCSDVTIMIYHTWWHGFHFSVDLLQKLAEIETVRVLKWSSPNQKAFCKGILALKDNLIIVDNSGQYVTSHSLGCSGFITHISNFWPSYARKLWHLLEDQDYPAVNEHLGAFNWPWSDWCAKVMTLTCGEGPFIKATMEEVGLQAGPPRPPCVYPPDHLRDELRVLMRQAGVPKAAIPAHSAP